MKILLSVLLITFLSGCASNFTSISKGEKAGQYYLTEITLTFPVPTSELYVCDAESNTKMVCEEID